MNPVDWEARLAEQQAAYRARVQKTKDDRAERQERRDHGLAQRHADKLARTYTERCACGHLESCHDIGDRAGARIRTKCLTGSGPRGVVCPCKLYAPEDTP